MLYVNQTRLISFEYMHPRYWLTWVGVALLRLISLTPLRTRWRCGSLIGRLGFLLAKKRRHIVSRNIDLCFPKFSKAEKHQLVRDNFLSSGISIIETALAWFGRTEDFIDIVDIDGLEVLREAKSQGRGVMLLGVHLSTLDFCGAALAYHQPFDVMYRKNKNSLFQAIMTYGRERNFNSAIERNNIRGVIKRLKQGGIVWYGPDQDYGQKHSVFADFFGLPTATLTATPRIIRITESPIVVFTHYRDLTKGRYRINLQRLSANYPTGEDGADALLINQVVEQAIRQAPEQYWWLHRRFKTRPNGETNWY